MVPVPVFLWYIDGGAIGCYFPTSQKIKDIIWGASNSIIEVVTESGDGELSTISLNKMLIFSAVEFSMSFVPFIGLR